MRRDVSATRFVLAALATWRVTHLLSEEDGPGDVVVRARARLGDSPAGALMDCFACMSVWVAAPLARTVAPRGADAALAWLALSGAACLLERIAAEPMAGTMIDTREGIADGMLWRQAGGAQVADIIRMEPAAHPG
ncbi:DUF1360 domain-containing protein [Solirubrobacter ginsenosidimutans]|uniref:DUF1360 domain-containing protein n=1 Tax=Solirubrobacter ginsenosidimutans TaxID=490573 RepID=A0A9X3MZ77_9ACTN|nr:DUF1360 domain-containing protein [Solirubrobacter ginsenosidimutans]MDA0165711.1 DUF1360 domain-containing protein [Solirubrobacter ginsenosidimutans]